MSKTNCLSCGRYLGENLKGDVYCKCQFYNILREGKITKLVHKSLYTKATAHMTG